MFGKSWRPELKAKMLGDVDEESRRAGTGLLADDLF